MRLCLAKVRVGTRSARFLRHAELFDQSSDDFAVLRASFPCASRLGFDAGYGQRRNLVMVVRSRRLQIFHVDASARMWADAIVNESEAGTERDVVTTTELTESTRENLVSVTSVFSVVYLWAVLFRISAD